MASMMNRLSLVKKFTLYSFIAFIITSSSLSLILSHYMKRSMELSELVRIVWTVMFLGLIALYVFLLRTVYNASGTLIRQNTELLEGKKHLEEAIRKLNFSYRETVAAASATIDARDAYTAGHSRRVADIACKVGKELGLEDRQLECLELASQFHDIGKIGVPEAKKYCKHAACPVPSAIIKGVEVACGLALPKDVEIKITKA